MNTFEKIMGSIVAFPLALIGAICICPFVVLYILIDLPVSIVQDIWINPED